MHPRARAIPAVPSRAEDRYEALQRRRRKQPRLHLSQPRPVGRDADAISSLRQVLLTWQSSGRLLKI